MDVIILCCSSVSSPEKSGERVCDVNMFEIGVFFIKECSDPASCPVYELGQQHEFAWGSSICNEPTAAVDIMYFTPRSFIAFMFAL